MTCAIPWVLTITIVLSACSTRPDASVPQPPGRTVTVQLVAINDLHGQLEPPPGSNGRINGVEAGGVEYLATHVKRAIAQQPHSIVVGAGDLVGASPMASGLFHDEPTIEALDALGLGITSVGNHEFDEGVEELLRLKRGGCHQADGCQDGDGFTGARFEYLAANVVRRATGAPLFPATAIRAIGGVKIGFIGETFTATSQIVGPAVNRDLRFLDEAATANARAADLKRQGVHAIVLLTHSGLEQGEGGTDPNGCVAPSGVLEPVLAGLSRDIGVVVSGHTHASYNCRIGERLVTSASSYGRVLTRILLEIDSATGRIVRTSATNQVVTRDVPKDAAVTTIVRKYAGLVEQRASEVVGSVTRTLLREANAAGESPLGNVIADAQLAATSGPDRGAAVVAFMNRGGIRAEIAADPPASAERPAPVTYRALHDVQPFGNVVMTFTMSGDMIKRLLEQQFDYPAPGRTTILQVSRGFTYRYRASAPAGQRVDADSIQVGGRRIGPGDRIRVAASDFLLGGGDALTVFGEGTERLAGGTDIEALVDYFKARSPVLPPPLDRIIRID